MEHIDCLVDTRPMANELDHVAHHVSGTTTAVVAMQTAVVKADQEAADYVCQNVNRGFHSLMSSQLSQKIAKLKSDVDSHLMRLNQQTKQLLAIKKQMERDYQRAALRYGKIFTAINKELRQKVQELDQPIFRFAFTEIETTRNRMLALTATVPVAQSESVADAQRILTSNIKYHGMQVLDATKSFVADMEAQKELTNRILLEKQGTESTVRYMPVVVSESNFEQGVSSNVYCSKELLSDQNAANVCGDIIQTVASFNWHKTENSALVDNELVRMMAESDIPERVKKTMSSLIEASEKYQSL